VAGLDHHHRARPETQYHGPALSGPSDTPTLEGARGGDKTRPGETASVSGTGRRDDAPITDGDRVGRYTILRKLGSGGMGVVHAAYDPRLDRQVALKLLNHAPDGATEGGSEAPAQRRLLREAQAMARLAHPNVVTVHEVDTHGDQVFMAMEYVDGQTLSQWMKDEGVRPWQEVRRIFVEAGRGLAAAHAAGLIHRDFKPDNVMLGKDGRVRVMDFGLARAAGGPEETARAPVPGVDPGSDSRPLSEKVTRTGATLGTPAYMSPEQHLGLAADERSDQFSFAVALYQGLYGERPFPGKTAGQLAFSVTQGEMCSPPANIDVPGWLHGTVLRALAVKPEERWPTMESLLEALQRDATSGRRRILLYAIVGSVVVGAAGVTLVRSGDAAVTCDEARQSLVGVWDAERKQALRQAFEASDSPAASGSLESTVDLLDAYAEAWTRQRVAACEATHVAHVQSPALLDLRTACLERRRHELDALVEVLVEAQTPTIERSVQAAAGLSPVQACADLDGLLAQVPLPDDERTRTAVEALRQRLSRAKALEVAGQFEASLDIATPTVQSARELGYRPVEAEAGLRLGWALARAGRYPEAEEALVAAYRAARAGGDHPTAAEIQAMLTWLVGEAMNRHQEGLRWGLDAMADVEHLGRGSLIHAQLLTNLGSVFTRLSKFEEAAEHHRQALAIYDASFEKNHPRTAAVLNNLAIAELEGGHTAAAVQTHRSALEMRERLHGENHPDVATSLNNLGNALRRMGKVQEALRAQERALEIREKSLGADHPRVAGSLGSLAIAYAEAGRLDEALEKFREATRRFENAHGENHIEVASSLSNLAQALTMAGQLDEAMETQERALQIRSKTVGPKHPATADSHASIGEILATQGKVAEALGHYEKALAIVETSLSEDHPRLATALIRVASTKTELGRPREALQDLERALEIVESKEGDPRQVAEVKFHLADALWQAGRDRHRARALAAQSEAIYADQGPGSKQALETVQTWRAAHG
jgi:eukaryotic-like serine/threonine-protein kinase